MLQNSLYLAYSHSENLNSYLYSATPHFGVADLGYERLNMQAIETSIPKTSGFSSYFFHTLIKQCQICLQYNAVRYG
jgi:hypothetical protein